MKTAIVTGASRGIGKAIALASAKHVTQIAITSYHHKDELDKAAEELQALGLKVFALSGDSKDPEFVSDFVSEALERFGAVDYLINNAGISKVGVLQSLSNEEWNEMIGINLSSVFYYCKAVIPYMLSRRSGCILNTSSVWGSVGASCEVAYSATKGGINAFTKALGKELAPCHIPVNAISYGAIDTSMNAHLTEGERAMLEAEIPYGRMATAEEAASYAWTILTSPDYMTGQILTFDGGWC